MKYSILFILTLFILAGCQKNIDKTEVIYPPTSDPIFFVISSVKGQVVDGNGDPVAQVQLNLDDNITNSDASGNFEFREVNVKTGSHVSALKDGFFTGGASCYAQPESESYVSITLQERGTPSVISASLGGEVSFGDAKLNLLPGSIVDANGAAHNGNVNVFARYIDPTDPNLREKVSGNFTGIGNGEKLALSTFGTLEFELEDISGNSLELGPDEEAEITFPVPLELQGLATQESPIWLFDHEQGYWYEATDTCYYNSSNTCYKGTCSSPGSWSCCIKLDAIELGQTVYNNDGTPASFLPVEVIDLVYNFVYWGYTDSSGYWHGTIPETIPLQERIEDHCAVVLYDEPIGAFATNTKLPELTLPTTTSQYSINVTGILSDCAGTPLSEGHVSVFLPDQGNFIYQVDNSGVFDFDVYLKCVQFPNLEVRGFDNTNTLRTTASSISMPGNHNLGTINACETKDDYLLATINGTNHHYFPVSFEQLTVTPKVHLIHAGSSNGSFAKIEIEDYNGVGIYNQNNVSLIDNNVSPPVISTMGAIIVDVTLDDGTAIEGTIQGTINTNFGTYTINSDFRALHL